MSDIKLNSCPFCGVTAMWCGNDPTEAHACHIIRCEPCDVNFDMCAHNDVDCEKLSELQQHCADKFNAYDANQEEISNLKHIIGSLKQCANRYCNDDYVDDLNREIKETIEELS